MNNKNNKPKETKPKRKKGTANSGILWVESQNICPICDEVLSFPIGSGNVIPDAAMNIKSANEYKHWAEEAHIISHGNLKYKNEYKIVAENSLIRSRTSVYESFKDDFKNKYKDDFIESVKNKMLLCHICHQNIDGKLFENENDFKKWFDGFHRKNSNEQVSILVETKSKTKKRIGKMSDIKLSNEKELVIFSENSSLLNTLNNFKISLNYESISGKSTDSRKALISAIDNNKGLKTIFDKQDTFKGIFKDGYNILLRFNIVDKKHVITIYISESRKSEIVNTKTKETFIKDSKNLSDKLPMEWVLNSSNQNSALKKKKEFLALRSLLLEKLYEYSVELNKGNNNYVDFDSFSIAYMARWGTGKTTMIRSLTEDLKDKYNSIEINLWHISNSINTSKDSASKDSLFVRQIIKEAISQLSSDPDLVAKYMDSKRVSRETKEQNDVKSKMIDSLIMFPEKSSAETIIKERNKFLDQHISTLSSVIDTIFNNTYRPTIFIFDDLDRIEDEEKVIAILDSLVAFLNIRNSVYIIPVDEAKVMRAISKTKIGKNPYDYISKYFTYSVRAPFIPRLNTLSIIKEILDELKDVDLAKKLNEETMRMAAQTFPSTYRGIKDYLNSYKSNSYILSDNSFLKEILTTSMVDDVKPDRERVILLATILQIEAPLLTDFMAKDIKRKDVLQNAFELNDQSESFVSNLINELHSAKNMDGNYRINNPEREVSKMAVKNGLKDLDFWSSLTSIEMSNTSIENLGDIATAFMDSINMTEKTEDKVKLMNLAIKKLQDISHILTVFKIRNQNSSFNILLWTALTLSEITEDDAVKFVKNIDAYSALLMPEKDKGAEYLKQKHEENMKQEINSKGEGDVTNKRT